MADQEHSAMVAVTARDTRNAATLAAEAEAESLRAAIEKADRHYRDVSNALAEVLGAIGAPPLTSLAPGNERHLAGIALVQTEIESLRAENTELKFALKGWQDAAARAAEISIEDATALREARAEITRLEREHHAPELLGDEDDEGEL